MSKALTPDADPRILAGAIRRAVGRDAQDAMYATKWEHAYAAALLAVLDECEPRIDPLDPFNKYEVGGAEAVESIIRAIARALIERGVVLTEEE